MPKIEVILWAESEAEAREFIDLVGDKAEYSIRRAYVAKKSAGKRDVGFKYQDGVYFPYDLRIGATLAESIVAPRFVTDLVQWCTPDVILSSESKALIAVETTYHILTFNNVAQRIPHQVRSASLGVPSVIFQKVDYSLTTELTWFAKTFVKATKIYGTPCLALMFDEPGYSKARDQLIDLVNSAVKESKEFDSVAELILKRMEEIASLFDVGNGSTAVYGDAGTLGGSGVYGLRTINNTGLAVKGISATSYGVYGKSVGGEGIKAVTSSMNAGAVYGQNTAATELGLGWAGYFNGRLGSGSDIISNRFLATNLRTSIMPFTSGQVISGVSSAETFGGSSEVHTAFDGTNVWAVSVLSAASDRDIFKFRASDGKELLTASTPAASDVGSIQSIVFDGSNIWVADNAGHIAKRDMTTGALSGNLIHLLDQNNVPVSGTVSKLAVSTESGQKYLWAPAYFGGTDYLYKINISAADPSLPANQARYSLGSGFYPRSIVYDGTYIWVLSNTALTVRRYLATTPTSFTDYTIQSHDHYPDGMVFDGEYIWIVSWDNSMLERLWAEDPGSTSHPRLNIDLSRLLAQSLGGGSPYYSHAKGIGFDGTYIWLTISFNPGYLVRIPARVNAIQDFGVCNGNNTMVCTANADCAAYGGTCNIGLPESYKVYPISNTVVSNPAFMTFDGTNIWVSSYMSDGVKLAKVFSGTGLGQTDLNTVVNLNPPGVCTGAANRSCIANADCTGFGSGICNVTAQPGNFHINGSATIGQGLTVTAGDVVVNTNLWGGSEETVSFDGVNPVSCSAGTFMRGVTINSSNNISQISCRGL